MSINTVRVVKSASYPFSGHEDRCGGEALVGREASTNRRSGQRDPRSLVEVAIEQTRNCRCGAGCVDHRQADADRRAEVETIARDSRDHTVFIRRVERRHHHASELTRSHAPVVDVRYGADAIEVSAPDVAADLLRNRRSRARRKRRCYNLAPLAPV
ncbi:MAG: hypothetical protein QM736_00495 [Vicinamibacterales bacterium]